MDRTKGWLSALILVIAVATLALLVASKDASTSVHTTSLAPAGSQPASNSAQPRLAMPGGAGEQSTSAGPADAQASSAGILVVQDYHHDVSPPLREIPISPAKPRREEGEGPDNPRVLVGHTDQPDPVVQTMLAPLAMPSPILNFNGIPFPGVGCNCAPPDTNGEVGATQYVQIVNEGYQVFDKVTGNSLLGPNSIESIWSGFGGACQTGGFGDPVALYDQLANRWVITEFASSTGGVPITDECVAVSTSGDATGSYYRYGFHLGSNFYDYPHLGVWPDAYYMSMNVFNSSGTSYLGPQPFAFDRGRMLQGLSATFVSPVGPMGSSVDPILPADLDGSILPASGAPESFVRFPGAGAYTTYHFHVDFITPANSTWTTFASPAAAGFTRLCPGTRACVPQLGQSSGSYLDGIGDRLMFRLAYRRFDDGHESVVGNYSVSSGGVAGVRWFELRGVTSGPVTVYQESTYQPDTTWRWMGSAAMDAVGDIAVGFSASSSSIYPQIRYAGRLVGDPLSQLSQGEAHLFDGTGSQNGTSNRWGDYSDMTVDPVDGCTFWYTQEYYQTTGSFNWRTRIGNFVFPSCLGGLGTPTPTGSPTNTATNTPVLPTNTPTNTRTNTPVPPTSTPTSTRTNTPVPPTSTPTSTRTNTPVPPTSTRTNTPTNTAVLPTNTRTPTPTNTAIVPTSTRTHTAVVQPSSTPSSTRTNTPVASSTAAPPTATPLQPTNTPPAQPTNTPAQPTNTSVPPSATQAPPSVTSAPPLNTATELPATATPLPPTATPCTLSFTDVPETDPFYTYVRCLACRGIISGYNDNTFRPGNNITRGQISKMVSGAAGFEDAISSDRQTYTDVLVSNTFWLWIERLTLHNVMGGYLCGGVGEPCDAQQRPYFRWAANATRGQLSKIVANADNDQTQVPSTQQTFEDVPNSNPFWLWIERLAQRGVMGGYTCSQPPAGQCVPPQNRAYFLPFNNVTRGQASKIVANTFYPDCQIPSRR